MKHIINNVSITGVIRWCLICGKTETLQEMLMYLDINGLSSLDRGACPALEGATEELFQLSKFNDILALWKHNPCGMSLVDYAKSLGF